MLGQTTLNVSLKIADLASCRLGMSFPVLHTGLPSIAAGTTTGLLFCRHSGFSPAPLFDQQSRHLRKMNNFQRNRTNKEFLERTATMRAHNDLAAMQDQMYIQIIRVCLKSTLRDN